MPGDPTFKTTSHPMQVYGMSTKFWFPEHVLHDGNRLSLPVYIIELNIVFDRIFFKGSFGLIKFYKFGATRRPRSYSILLPYKRIEATDVARRTIFEDSSASVVKHKAKNAIKALRNFTFRAFFFRACSI